MLFGLLIARGKIFVKWDYLHTFLASHDSLCMTNFRSCFAKFPSLPGRVAFWLVEHFLHIYNKNGHHFDLKLGGAFIKGLFLNIWLLVMLHWITTCLLGIWLVKQIHNISMETAYCFEFKFGRCIREEPY